MKKNLSLVILLCIGITPMFAQNCFECDPITKAFTIGNSIASGNNSFAGGNESSATAENSFVFGDHSLVTQSGGIAIGDHAQSLAYNSIVLGQYVGSNGASSITFGAASSLSPLLNNKNNSIMFGVNEFPSLTIHKPAGATKGYLGIGTDDPKAMAHVVGTLLIDRTATTASSLQFKHPNTKGEDPGGDSLIASPYYWDIFSDNYGLKFNTVGNPNKQCMLISRGGSVGIGITNPQASLHVDKNIIAEGDITTFNKLVFVQDLDTISTRWEIERTLTGLKYACHDNYNYPTKALQDILFLGNNGNIGIGKTNPAAILDVNGSFQAKSATISGAITAGGALSAQSATIAETIIGNALTINTNANITERITGNALTINTDANIAGAITGNALNAQTATISGDSYFSGNVGIGVNPTAKLDVLGVIRAHEVKVCLNQGCDFVFDDDYNLMTLQELNNFIKTNKHLPSVAPAAEMEAEGINLSEMNATLLQKVEELTLYIIQLEKRICDVESKKGGE